MDYHSVIKKKKVRLETEEEAQWSGAVDLYEGSNSTATHVPGDPTPLLASAGIRYTHGIHTYTRAKHHQFFASSSSLPTLLF